MNDDAINDGHPFLTSQAAGLGIPSTALRDLLDTKRIRRVFRGVYVDSIVADTRMLRAEALHLIKPPGAIFYGHTAVFLLGVDAFPPKDRFNFTPECVVPHHTGRCRREFVVCHEGYLPSADLMEIEGLVVTTPVRTTSDLLRSQWRPNALAAADALAHSGHITRAEVVHYVSQLRRYPGIVQARSLATLIEPKAESPGESWQRLRLVDSGFPIPESQVIVRDRLNRIISILDHGYLEARVGIDYDGREWHEDDVAQEHDARKRGVLRNDLGWRLSIGKRARIFGDDPGFEIEIGRWLGITPLPRRW